MKGENNVNYIASSSPEADLVSANVKDQRGE
jgi:hypothetical protein